MMRSSLHAACIAAALLAGAPAVLAQSSRVDGRYQVTFEEVVDTCDGAGHTLHVATVGVRQTGEGLRVSVPNLPAMNGTLKRGTKFKVEERERDIKLSATGRVVEGKIQFVLIVERYTDGKPVCTQSWSAAGKRK